MKKFMSLLMAFTLTLALAACGGAPAQEGSEISMDLVVTTIQNVYGENYLPSEELDQESFNSITGLTPDLYDEYIAQVPMMSTQADLLMVVKTQDVEKVKEVMNAYQTYQIEGAMQYPMNMNKVSHSVLYTSDEYVIFFILGGYPELDIDPMEDEEAYNAAEGQYFDEQNAACIAALDELFR